MDQGRGLGASGGGFNFVREFRDSFLISALDSPLLGDFRGSVTLMPVERSRTPLNGWDFASPDGSGDGDSSAAVLVALKRIWFRAFDFSSNLAAAVVVVVVAAVVSVVSSL